MATGKKSFILYLDQRGTFEKLSDEQAGQLIKHIFAYCSDENPTGDFITELAFEQVKQSLKRDLIKYKSIKERNKANGNMGGRPKKDEPKKPSGLFGNPDEPKKPDSVSDSDSDSDIKKKEGKPKKVFIPPTILEVEEYFKENGYNNQSAQKMFRMYDVANWADTKGNKIKNWKQKAIGVWFKDENKATIVEIVKKPTPRAGSTIADYKSQRLY